MENVVSAIFNVESEAYKAFSEIRRKPRADGYLVAEAVLLKRDDGTNEIAESFDAAGVVSDDTATGMLVGSVAGILGGPLGVLLGASCGALVGGAVDAADAIDSASMAEITAGKLYNGEVAIIALVQEEEPAFDAALEGYDVTIIRRTATDVIAEVEEARALEAELANQARMQLRAERKAEAKAAYDDRVAAIKARFAELGEVASAGMDRVGDKLDAIGQKADGFFDKVEAKFDELTGDKN